MVEMNVIYQGDLRCEATHGPSGTQVLTDAPKDNHGKGGSFSPTDLLATALGTCMMTLMGIAAKAMDLDMTGSTASVKKDMTPPPRRIGALTLVMHMKLQADHAQREKLVIAAMTCPVHESLNLDIKISVEWNWL